MGKGAVLSGFLHLAVLLLAVFGLPWLSNTEEVLQATPVTTISAEQFAELQSKTPPAEKKQDKPKDQEIPPAPPAPEVAQPQPEAEEPAPPEPPPAAEPAPPAPQPPQQAEQQQEPAAQPEPPQPPQPEPQVIAPQPEPPKPEPVPAEAPKVAEAQPKPVPPKKPAPPKKKDEPKKKEEAAKPKDKPKEEQVADDSSSWLKNLDKKLKQKQQPQPKPTQTQQAEAEPDPGIPQRLPFGEEDAIRRQIEPHWNYNPGLPGIEKMRVELIVTMNPDGSVQKVEFADPQAVFADPNFRAFAESAQRAVYVTQHIKMPPNRSYDVWRRIYMDFYPPNT